MWQRLRGGVDSNLNILLKLLLIVVLILAIGYLGISIYANVVENRGEESITPPDIAKAHYVLTVGNTLEQFYSDNVTVVISPNDPAKLLYKVNNYWEVRDGVYKLFKHELVLDEYYWGKIIMQERTK